MAEGYRIGNLIIPIAQGEKGEKGDAGKIVGLTITMLSSTATPTVENVGTEHEANYVIGIPRGTGISTAEIVDGELIITLTDNTELNLGTVNGVSITNVEIDENYDLVITLSDGSEITAGNIETELEGILSDYYTKDEVDTEIENWVGDIKDNFGHSLSLSMNPTTYVLSVSLLDYDGTTLDTKTVDLPLESMVVSGSYNNTTKKVILTLQGGSVVEFNVADLVAGLQSEITNANKLSADLVSDTNTTNKFVTATEKTKLSNAVTNTDYANGTTGGVVKINSTYGLGINAQGQVYGQNSTYEAYQSTNNNYMIAKGTLENVLTARLGNLETILEELDVGGGISGN